jgi:16S rRNA (cytosine1402-N4)-methyltransferase
LNPQAGQTFVDATLGYGGHSFAILERLNPEGKLIAFDQDPIERVKTEGRLREKISQLSVELIIGGINFSEAWNYIRQSGVGPVDGVLADLGLSSMQIDTPERGFSFKVDAPLDLRMNPLKGKAAAACWPEFSPVELEEILRDYSDEPHARQIAEQLLKDRPQTTVQMADSVRKVLSKLSRKAQVQEGDTPIRRAFQALRIHVNQEFEVLEKFLSEIPNYLKPGGRVAILTFHSGEDRRVKKYFQHMYREQIYSQISEEPLRPSMQEQVRNPRSKAAKLRWAQKK